MDDPLVHSSARHDVVTWTLETSAVHAEPDELELVAEFTRPDGGIARVPAFWDGGGRWAVRYASGVEGLHVATTRCAADPALDGIALRVEVRGDGTLRAPVRVGEHGLADADGASFSWLADTWWWGFTDRVSDDEFLQLARDRAEKGFTVVQVVAGLCGDAGADDPRQRNEGGGCWSPAPDGDPFGRLNPSYFDVVDRRVRMLVEAGLVPCVFGGWGYHLERAGVARTKRFWRYLVARYGAFPVVWCAAGEALMPHYSQLGTPEQAAVTERLREGWSEVLRSLRETDPFGSVVTVHPSPASGHLASTDMVDPALIDLVMLQTGHADKQSIEPSLATLDRVRAEFPATPVLNAEVCYEGIMGSSWQDTQRFLYWSHLLSGAAGHSYGAHGLWAFDTGAGEGWDLGWQWGEGDWRSAAAYPGGGQLGWARRLVDELGLTALTPLADASAPAASAADRTLPYAAETRSGRRVYYLPSPAFAAHEAPASIAAGLELRRLEAGARYLARYVNPRHAARSEPFEFTADGDGRHRLPDNFLTPAPTTEDWLLVIDRAR